MIFAIDIGNTNIVLGCIENGEILNITRIRTEAEATAAEYAIKIKEILDLYQMNVRSFEGAILSSVVPPINKVVSDAVYMVTGIECMIVGPGIKTGLNIKIDDPATLGADLAVGAVAAIAYYGAPAIVIDMGTATTITAVDETNSFVGGAFIPGLKLGLNALSAGTSLLPDISITAPPMALAKNTVDSMRSGAVYGTADMIDGMIERFEKELGAKCNVIATGGLAQAVVGFCRHEIAYDDNLLLKGLWVIYRKNIKK